MTKEKIITIIFLIAILFLAAFFRLWKLNEIPPGLYPDVAINGNDALDILQKGKLKVFYSENNGREGLFFWFIALSFLIFGPSVWSIKIVAAIFGILTVFGTYLLTKELFQNRNIQIVPPTSAWNYPNAVALLSSFFLAISFWHVNFSRIGFRAILMPFVLVFAFYFLYRGFNYKKLYNFIISGFFFALGFYTYISYRFVVFILAIALFSWWLVYKKEHFEKKYLFFIFYFLFFIFIFTLPIGLYFLFNPQDFFSRAADVSIFSQPNPLFSFLKSFIVHLGMFNIYGDANWRHNFAGSPQLFWPVGIFFLVGFILTIKDLIIAVKISNFKPACRTGRSQISNFLLLSWLFFMLLPGFLTYEGIPHALRTIGVIPVVFIFAAVGAFRIFEKLKLFYKTKRAKIILYILISIFLVSLVFAEFNKYFYQWANNPNLKDAFSENFVEIGNYLNSLPETIIKYVIVNQSGVPVPYPNGIPMPSQTSMFIERTKYGKIRANYILPEDLNKIEIKKETVIVPLHYDEGLLGEMILTFPNGKLEKEQGIWIYKILNIKN